jgi:hypothetical protein
MGQVHLLRQSELTWHSLTLSLLHVYHGRPAPARSRKKADVAAYPDRDLALIGLN